MNLRKDDPLYYKLKINGLIKNAFENGLKIQAKVYESKIAILFKANNGDVAEVELEYND